MNKEQKAAVVDRVAGELEASDAVLALDYRGLSVKQAAALRGSLREADATFQIVKNTLTERAADQAGAEHIKPFLDGPTALAFVRGDVALAAKALSRFRRDEGILEWKGGQMGGEPLTPEEIESIAKLPAREQLHAQLVGTIASPLTGLVRGLGSLVSGLAIQLEQIREQGLVGGSQVAEGQVAEAETEGEGETEAADEPETAQEEAPADPQPAEEATEEATEEAGDAPSSDAEAPGDPVAEGEAAEQEETSDTPSEGEGQEEG